MCLYPEVGYSLQKKKNNGMDGSSASSSSAMDNPTYVHIAFATFLFSLSTRTHTHPPQGNLSFIHDSLLFLFKEKMSLIFFSDGVCGKKSGTYLVSEFHSYELLIRTRGKEKEEMRKYSFNADEIDRYRNRSNILSYLRDYLCM